MFATIPFAKPVKDLLLALKSTIEIPNDYIGVVIINEIERHVKIHKAKVFREY